MTITGEPGQHGAVHVTSHGGGSHEAKVAAPKVKLQPISRDVYCDSDGEEEAGSLLSWKGQGGLTARHGLLRRVLRRICCCF